MISLHPVQERIKSVGCRESCTSACRFALLSFMVVNIKFSCVPDFELAGLLFGWFVERSLLSLSQQEQCNQGYLRGNLFLSLVFQLQRSRRINGPFSGSFRSLSSQAGSRTRQTRCFPLHNHHRLQNFGVFITLSPPVRILV